MRKPFAERVEAYLETIVGFKDSTKARMRKNLRTVDTDLRSLPHYGDPDRAKYALAPTKVREEHVRGLLQVWADRGLQASFQRKLLGDLAALLAFCGNPVIERMRKMRTVQFPKVEDPEPESLDEAELARLRASAASWEGWRGAVARLLVGLLPECGLRPKEVRLAKLADVNLKKGRLLVSNPKTGAKNLQKVLTTTAKTVLADFLAEREAYLGDGRSEWLIPLRKTVPVGDKPGEWVAVVGPWSDASMRKLKADLVERSGVAFGGWKTLRATYGQRLTNRGLRLEDVSQAMRHKTVETTRKYYVKLQREQAEAAAVRALDGPVHNE